MTHIEIPLKVSECFNKKNQVIFKYNNGVLYPWILEQIIIVTFTRLAIESLIKKVCADPEILRVWVGGAKVKELRNNFVTLLC